MTNTNSIFSSNVGIGDGLTQVNRLLELFDDTNDVIPRFIQASQGNVGLELIRQSGTSNTSNRDWRILNDNSGIFVLQNATNGTDYITQFRISPSVTGVDTDIRPLQDNTFSLGSSSARWDNIFATNPLINTSDFREKKEIKAIQYGLEALEQLMPVSYFWKSGDADKKLGLIAQDVLKIIPEVVNVPENKEDLLGIKYTELIPVLIQSIKELNEKVEKQQMTIDELVSKSR